MEKAKVSGKHDRRSSDTPYESSDLAVDNLLDEFDLTAADLQDLEIRV